MKLTFERQAMLSKLADELILIGVDPVQTDGASAIQGSLTEVYIFIPDDTSQVVIDRITTVVNAHDPTPLAAVASVEDYLIDLDYRISKIELGL